jgi:hypothetical protein
MTNTVRRVLLGTLFGAAMALVIGLHWDQAAAASGKDGKKAGGLRIIKAPLRAESALKWDDGTTRRDRSPRAFCPPGNPNTYANPRRLVFDTLGTTTVGVGPSSYVTAMQHLVRFGGGSATTQLCGPGQGPSFVPVALSWSIFTCTTLPMCPDRVPAAGLMTTQRVNIWDAVYDGIQGRFEPNARVFTAVFRSPGNIPGGNTVNEFVCKTFTGAPPVNALNGNLFAGVGARGPNDLKEAGRVWALAGEPDDPDHHREWVGSGATNAVTMGPTTFSTLFYPIDFEIRLTVDGACVPVELERFEAAPGK